MGPATLTTMQVRPGQHIFFEGTLHAMSANSRRERYPAKPEPDMCCEVDLLGPFALAGRRVSIEISRAFG